MFFRFRQGLTSNSFLVFLLTAGLGVGESASAQSKPSEELLREAITLHQAGKIDAAITSYRGYLKAHPDSILAASNLGAAYASAGQYEEAITQYNLALKLQPGNAPVQLNLAIAYYKTGQIERAAQVLELVHKAAPNEVQPTLLLADCWLSLGENKKVIQLLNDLAVEQPDNLAVSYLLGSALVRDNQVTRGQVIIDRILRNGQSAESYLLLGTTKLNAKDYPAALADLARAVELNPNLPGAYTYYGQALLATGDPEPAAAAFRKALELNKNDFNANLNLGVLRKDEEKFDEARACFERALHIRPHNPLVRYQLASTTLQQDGDLSQAAAELEAVVKEVPAFTEAHVALATVYYRLKRKVDGDRERAVVQKLNRETQAKQQLGINVK